MAATKIAQVAAITAVQRMGGWIDQQVSRTGSKVLLTGNDPVTSPVLLVRMAMAFKACVCSPLRTSDGNVFLKKFAATTTTAETRRTRARGGTRSRRGVFTH